ncbi:geraniol 8-hydroxylase-like [Magnolia sinica]|uniref:geraniol 8-hydroxylase-like n=1 Tax=Magnolia sinica TaxID=86752 RepID=UPI00265B0802|nr:geraniol 8-hydroxylase-like [Magnolia sinica]
MEFFYLLLCTSFLLIATHGLLSFRNWLSISRKLPPGPSGLPIVGSLFQIGDRPHESLMALAHAYGPLMSLRLGFVTTVVVSSADMAKEILQKKDHAFAGRAIPDSATAEADYELSVAWLPPSPLWRTLRKILNTQIMTIQRLDALQGLRNKKMVELVQHVREISVAGWEVNVGWLAFATTFNLLSSTVFSINLVDLKSDGAQEFKDAVSRIMEFAGKPNLSDYFPFLRPFDLQRIRRGVRGSYDRLQYRELGNARNEDFLDVLLDYSQEHGPEFDRRQVNSLLADLFIAGSDTTSTAIEWVMAELLHNPDKMAKAQKELADMIGTRRAIEESDIPQLSYLQAVVKQAMRLHPTVPLLPHRAVADVELCGFIIPKNTQVLINTWAIARDASIWEEPMSFKPERFLGSDVDFRGGNFGFVPFGAGRRICPGMPLAVRMVSLMVATLIHSFDWKLPKGMLPHEMDMSDRFGVTLQKAYPLVAVPFLHLV